MLQIRMFFAFCLSLSLTSWRSCHDDKLSRRFFRLTLFGHSFLFVDGVFQKLELFLDELVLLLFFLKRKRVRKENCLEIVKLSGTYLCRLAWQRRPSLSWLLSDEKKKSLRNPGKSRDELFEGQNTFGSRLSWRSFHALHVTAWALGRTLAL